jgi:predicted ATP-binding protein involved in virulence
MTEISLQGKADPRESEATFLLDEPECHMHPAWQRKILPAFQRLFPKAQIFVATHSPFVIASVNHGWIHPITLGSDGKAKFEKSISASSGESYVSVVEDIMGLKEWFDPETEDLLAKFRKARDEAYQGHGNSQSLARKLATEIGGRSVELEFMMGRELIQMDRQLDKQAAPK